MRVVATAGHVDHGKSTLLHRLTGMEPDRWEEERRRGLTIDLGFVWTTLEGATDTVRVAFVDVPGHQRFIPNMMAGVCSLEKAILVVAADDGWSHQTTEHVAILDLLGVSAVVTAITKSDLVDDDRIEEVVADVTTRLESTTLSGAPVIPIDSRTGRGIPQLVDALVTRLSDVPDAQPSLSRRIWVDRAFSVRGSGTVVTGTMQGGSVTVGDYVQHAQSGREVRIRGMHVLGQPTDRVEAGWRVAINLPKIDVGDIKRGDALLEGDWTMSSIADVTIRSISDQPIRRRGAWHIHVGTAEVPVRMSPILDEIEPGGSGLARLELSRPLPLRHGDRFIIRAVGIPATVGGGYVLDPQPMPKRKGLLGRLQLAENLEALEEAALPSARVRALLDLHGGALQVRQVRSSIHVEKIEECSEIRPLADWFALDHLYSAWQGAATESVRSGDPHRGVRTADVLEALEGENCPPELQRPLIEALRTNSILDVHGDILTLTESTSAFLDARWRRRATVFKMMTRDPLNPPPFSEVIEAVALDSSDIQDLFESKVVVDLGDTQMAAVAIRLAYTKLAEAFGGRSFSVAEARDLWDTTRKFAVPLLEYFSESGITEFDGKHHRLNSSRPSIGGYGA